MILGATLLWSIEIIIAKRLLVNLSSLTVGIARMAGGAAILVVYGIVSGAFAAMGGRLPHPDRVDARDGLRSLPVRWFVVRRSPTCSRA